MAVGLLGPTAVIARAQGFPQLIEEFGFPVDGWEEGGMDWVGVADRPV